MNYVVAVFADCHQAEAAQSELAQAGLPSPAVSILGQGHRGIEDFAVLDPKKPARQLARLMAFWLIPFGFIAGIAFNLSTQFELVSWAGRFGNQVLGGIFGALAGAMGSFFVGGGTGLLFGGDKEAVPYRKLLKSGKYAVVVQGAPNITNRASRLLKQLDAERIQNFVDPQA